MRSLQQLTVLGILCCCCLTIVAWMPDASSYTRRSNNVNLLLPTTTFLVNTKTTTTTTTVLFAGFGNVEKNDKKEGVKLKPKQQWDRYMTNLKKMERVKVAVRIKGTEDWIVAGYVKSIDNAFTELAVIKQKALIADHARRLFPLKLTMKDTIEWGYNTEKEGSDWTVLDKNIENNEIDDKKIGFEGTPDPKTGYYCVYNEGRIVNMADIALDPNFTSKSKRPKQ